MRCGEETHKIVLNQGAMFAQDIETLCWPSEGPPSTTDPNFDYEAAQVTIAWCHTKANRLCLLGLRSLGTCTASSFGITHQQFVQTSGAQT